MQASRKSWMSNRRKLFLVFFGLQHQSTVLYPYFVCSIECCHNVRVYRYTNTKYNPTFLIGDRGYVQYCSLWFTIKFISNDFPFRSIPCWEKEKKKPPVMSSLTPVKIAGCHSFGFGKKHRPLRYDTSVASKARVARSCPYLLARSRNPPRAPHARAHRKTTTTGYVPLPTQKTSL